MTRVNAKTRVRLAQIILTPYRQHHVVQYTKWMQDKELQRLTGSEPLSLEEEYKNQISWRDDPDKCTFIVTDLKDKMIGDVNIFLSKDDDVQVGELNVMIAEPSYRRKGLGTQAVAGMMWYAEKHLHVKRFLAKVTLDNVSSIAMFTAKLGFKEISRSAAFKEVTLASSDDVSARLATFFGDSLPKQEEFPNPKTEEFRLRGNKAFENRDFVQAMACYDEAILIDHRDEVLRGNRSAARLRAGEMFGALSDALICMKLAPDYAKGRHRLGNAWAALGYEDKAIAVYKEATKDFPEQQKSFEEIAKKSASSVNSPELQSNKVVLRAVKLAPQAGEMETSLQLYDKVLPIPLRLGCIIYLWKRMSGKERLEIYEEFVRAQFAGSAARVPTAEFLEKAEIPPAPNACSEAELPPFFVEYIASMNPKDDPLVRVAALALLFEASSTIERKAVGELLLAIVEKDASQ